MMGTSFSTGDEVEVSTDEDGFQEAWFEAKVFRVASKRPRRYTITYDSFLADDPSGDGGSSPQPRPLRETVDASHVRPRPPRRSGPGGGRFELHQPVDAMYKDGWWVGVVAAVHLLLGGGGEVDEERYTVCFPNTREEMEFRPSDLRAHLDWVDGMWMLPVLNGISQAAFVFVPGTPVEVMHSTTGGSSHLTPWIAATIIKHIWKNNLLVQYERLRVDGSSEEFLKEIVDSQYVRPLPPPDPDVLKFDLLEVVEVLHNDGCWCVGVILKILSTSRYIVKSEHWEEEVEVDRSVIRLPRDWVNGRWLRAKKADHVKSKKLHGTKTVGHKPQSQAKKNAYKANYSVDDSATVSDSHDEATVSKNKIKKGSTFQSQIRESMTCKKPMIGETLEDDAQLVDSLVMAGGTKSLTRVEREFCVAAPTLLDRGETHSLHSLTLEQRDSEIRSKGRSEKCTNVDSPSYPTPEDCNNGPSVVAKLVQESFVPKAPVGITELSMTGEQPTNIEGEGSKHQSKRLAYHSSSVSHEIKAVAESHRINSLPQNRKVVTRLPKRRKKIHHDDEMMQHSEENKRPRGRPRKARMVDLEVSRPRGRPRKERMVDLEVSLEGPQLKQPGDTNEVVVEKELTSEGDGRSVKGISAGMPSVQLPHCHGNEVKSVVAEVKNLTEEFGWSAKGTIGDASHGILSVCNGDKVSSAVFKAAQLTEVVQRTSGDVLDDISDVVRTPVHDEKEMDFVLSSSFIEDKGQLLLGDSALHLHWANEQLVDKEGDENLNLSPIVSQLKPTSEGDRSIENQPPQEILDATVSSDVRSKEISRHDDIHCDGVVRSMQNEVLGGVSEKEMTISDLISSTVTLPFVKTSSIWGSVDAMEVFEKMPQQPHFCPLKQYCEKLREGMAVGLMTTFANLADDSCKMQINDDRGTFQEMLNVLVHLEGHGFNVQAVQGRLEQLLRIKDKREKCEDKRASLEGLILERRNEGQKITESLDEITKRLTRWEEIVVKKLNNDKVISEMQMDLEAITRAGVSAEHDFDTALAAAW